MVIPGRDKGYEESSSANGTTEINQTGAGNCDQSQIQVQNVPSQAETRAELTGSFPSMASIHNFLSASVRAWNVTGAALWKQRRIPSQQKKKSKH